jgi:protein phosphatase 1 regulatory subunit 21
MSSNTNSDNCSVSSLDLNSSSSNINDRLVVESQNSKYEKLVQDYVKLRSKLTILKKAYVELSESSGKKDQSIRKYEQEVEGLNFRNQQLTSRVEILQRELEVAKSNSANNTNNPNTNLSSSVSSANLLTQTSSNSNFSNQNAANSQHVDILSEELQHKITENALLHRQLNELEVEFRLKLAKNEQALKQIESEKLLTEKKFELNEQSSKALIEKLQNDKIKLELNLIQLENQLRSTHHEMETKESEFKKENQELLMKNQNLLHMSNSSSSLSSLGTTSSTPTKKEIILEENLSAHLKTQMDCLCKIYNCLDERKSSIQSSKQALKCEQILSQQMTASVSNKFKNFDRISSEFFDSNHTLIQIIITDLTTPNQSSNNQEIDTLNKKLKIYLNKLDTSLFVNETNFSKNLSQLIQFTVFPGTSANNSSPSMSNWTLFCTNFLKNLSSIIDILDKVLFVLNEKLSLEYAQNYPSNITTLDECVVSYVTQLKQSFSQTSEFIQGNSNNFYEIATKLVASMKQKIFNESENNEMDASLNTNSEQSSFGNYSNLEKDLENLRVSLRQKDAEIKELSEKCAKLSEKSEKDFDDKERLRFKLDQMQGQFTELKNRESVQMNELEKFKHDKETLEKSLKEAENVVNVKESNTTSCIESSDLKKLESLTLDSYLKQIETLNQRINYLDSKAYYYYDEMKVMLERLKIQIDTNNMQENDLNEIKDQLERTRSSYEVQMSTMSDHLIEMTDRMTKQAEENENLKHEVNVLSNSSNSNLLNSKSSSKSKKSK